jgi:8-oxo-dGTP diphosphatase
MSTSMSGSYAKSWIAVDAVIFSIINGKLCVYLVQREKEPFKSKLELIGGLLEEGEEAEETLERKLNQALGKTGIYFEQFFTFTNPKRDPRERAVSVGFIALVGEDKLSDTKHWYPIDELETLAFDHQQIIQKACQYLKENINTIIVKQFMPKYFPLNQLQKAYETIEGKKYDNRNFRKSVIERGLVKETKKIEKKVSHRPATLYQFG